MSIKSFVLVAAVAAAATESPPSGRPRAPYKARTLDPAADDSDAAGAPPAGPGLGGPPDGARRRLQGHWAECGYEWHFEIGEDDDVVSGAHVGSQANPIVLVPDCPVTVSVAQGSHAFLALTGFSAVAASGAKPQLRFGWRVDDTHDETPLTAFSFRGYPRFEGAADATFFDWYYWPLLAQDEVEFVEHADNWDYYHCYGGCDYYDSMSGAKDACGRCDRDVDLRDYFDVLWIAVSTFPNKGPMTATYTASLFTENAALHAGDLDALRALYARNCEPYSHFPSGWTWAAWQTEDSPGRGERDSRHKPYCDWWPDMTLDGLAGVDDCTKIPGVTCDEGGRVVTLSLDTAGLRGALPAAIANLTALKRVELSNNRLEGPLPAFASDALTDVHLANNGLDGELACPAASVEVFNVDRNLLTGALPACFFDAPALSVLDLSSNSLDASIPPVGASSLGVLYLQQSGLKGPLDRLANLTNLGKVDLSRNFLEGDLREDLLDRLPKLYELNLAWNRLTGSVPHLPNEKLRIVDLSHNAFNGELTTQFDFFASNQDHGVASVLYLNANGFCGELPDVFYDLLTDSSKFVYDFDASQNHFRCAPSGGNEYFAQWAHTLGHDFGKCTPVADPRAVEPADDAPVAMPGNEIDVVGAFVATTEARCALYAGDRREEVPAFFVDERALRCRLPLDWPATPTTVAVAHYCADFSSVATLGDGFQAVTFVVANYTQPPTGAPFARPTAAPVSSAPSTAAPVFSPPTKSTEEVLAPVAVGGVAAAVVLAVAFGLCLTFVVKRELAGKPVFAPAPLVANPLRSPAARGGAADDDDDDDRGPPRYARSRHHRIGEPDVELPSPRADLAALVPGGDDTAL